VEKNKAKAIRDLVDSIRLLVRAVHTDTLKFSKDFGLTGPQSMVLRILADAGDMSSADLSRKLYVTPSNITGIIDRLERKELVKRVRKTEDRRVVLIALTSEGGKVAGDLPDPIETILISRLHGMESGRIEEMADCLHDVLELIDPKLKDREIKDLDKQVFGKN
jgi:DNA-binding MarR family transcriptional regulator